MTLPTLIFFPLYWRVGMCRTWLEDRGINDAALIRRRDVPSPCVTAWYWDERIIERTENEFYHKTIMTPDLIPLKPEREFFRVEQISTKPPEA